MCNEIDISLVIHQGKGHHSYIILTDSLNTLKSLDNTENTTRKAYTRKNIYSSKPGN